MVPRPGWLSTHDVAAALADDAVAGGQAEAAAVPSSFVVKKGSKRCVFRFVAHADSRVGDGNHDVFAGREAAPGNRRVACRHRCASVPVPMREAAALRHRVTRVHREVEDDLRELARIGFDVRRLRRAMEMALDA